MSSWSDGFLRSMQFWMFYLSFGIPLLGVLLGGLCLMVKDRTESELGRRESVALARKEQGEADRRGKTEADLRAQLAQSQQHARELEARQKELEEQRKALEAQRKAPQEKQRVITPEQRATFIGMVEFSPKGKVTVSVISGVDAATVAYANQIREMVGAAGYDVGSEVETRPGKQIPQGVFMLVGNASHPFAGAIQQALGDIGITATGLIDDSIAGNDIRIEVGSKP